MRRETFSRVRDISKVLRKTKVVEELDAELFGMLVEQIKVINLIQVDFILRSGVEVSELL